MECPVCKNEAELLAQLKPDGWIGCFCFNCLETHITKDPKEGWEPFKSYKEARNDMSSMFNIDTEYELLALAKYEFDVLVESFYYKVIACHT